MVIRDMKRRKQRARSRVPIFDALAGVDVEMKPHFLYLTLRQPRNEMQKEQEVPNAERGDALQ
jgi:hypothetical protein